MQTVTASADPVDKGLAARAVGVVFSPRSTYASVAARPRVAGALLLVLTIGVSASLVFFSTDVGKDALMDAQIRRMESIGRTVTDAQYAGLQRMLPYAGYFVAATQVVSVPILALAIAGISLAIFNAVLGGNATFRQVLAVVVHAQILLAAQQLFSLPLDYAKGSLASPTSLAVFLPFLDETSAGVQLFGSIDLFWIWAILNLSIGLGVLYKKRTAPIATSILVVYGLAALALAAARMALSGA
jgi:hypothetical protein